MAWHGIARHSIVWHGSGMCHAWHGMAWSGMVLHGMAWHGIAWHCILSYLHSPPPTATHLHDAGTQAEPGTAAERVDRFVLGDELEQQTAAMPAHGNSGEGRRPTATATGGGR